MPLETQLAPTGIPLGGPKVTQVIIILNLAGL